MEGAALATRRGPRAHAPQAYLEDFYHYCQKLGGATAEVMKDILQFEADRRTINITVNSIGTELQKEDRGTLYPNFGLLSPEGTEKLMKVDDQEQVKAILENYQVRRLAHGHSLRFPIPAARLRSLADSASAVVPEYRSAGECRQVDGGCIL